MTHIDLTSRRCLVVDSVTKLGPEARGTVLIGGSHCGVYAAYLVARAGAATAILNDAGVGKDEAGIAGLDYLDQAGVAAAAVGHDTARIGDGRHAAAQGIVRHVNTAAAGAGVKAGMTVRDAVRILLDQPLGGPGTAPPKREGRRDLPGEGLRPVHVVDSASLVRPEDAGSVVVTGSHGGLLGGRPETALKVDVVAALFNDAGVGIDRAGTTRLPALDARGIAAGTVDAWSARIGEGLSTYKTGVLSHVNETARAMGGAPGMSARDFVALAARRR